MKWALCLALVGTAVFLDAAQQKQPKTTSSSKAKAASKSGKPGSSPKKRRTRRAAGPSYPTHPDQERYREIQQALTDRGFFKGEVNGQWGDDSVDALKRFQADQKLANDGKINSLTLIGLGLGPKHDAAALTPPAAKPAPSPSPAETGTNTKSPP